MVLLESSNYFVVKLINGMLNYHKKLIALGVVNLTDMKKKDEIAYFDKEWDTMKAHLTAFLNEEQQEDLHRFRVQVKKLRAFLILIDSKKRHPELANYFRPVRMVFKMAGEIRNAYLNLELGKAYQNEMNEFLIAQHQLLDKAIADFIAVKDPHLKKIKKAYKNIAEKIKPVDDIHITMFYINNLEQIAAWLEHVKFDDQLHECRRLVKILIYNYKLVHTKLDIGFNEDYMQDIQTAIGDWHDNIVAMELFSQNQVKDEQTIGKLKKQQVKHQKKIKLLVQDFYNRATTTVEIPVEQIS